MSKKRDLTNQTFRRLTVIKDIGRDLKERVIWQCVCNCENKTIINVDSRHLLDGGTSSCGCLLNEKRKESNIKHGLKGTRIYSIYRDMNSRCYNKNRNDYKNYGERGIIICDEWLNKENGFISFYNWAINNGYTDKLSIDRKDVNGNYEPNNCRWSTPKEQGENRRNNINVEYYGEIHSLIEWSEIYNINLRNLYSRFYAGKTGDKLFK